MTGRACPLRFALVSLTLTELFATGCSSEKGVGAPSDGGADAPGAVASVWGSIEVQMQEAQLPSVGMRAARGLVSGKFYDGPTPNSMPLTAAMQVGSCQLLKPILPFCDPPCAEGRVCVAGNTCQSYPKARSVGEVSMLGLATPVVLAPVPPSFTYQSFDLAYPPCVEGAEISLSALGHTALNRCFAPLVMARDEVPRVRRGEPLRLAWTAPTVPGVSRIEIRLDIAHHGGQKTGEILCDVADIGSFDVPAPLIDALIDLGLAGAPSVVVSRLSSVALRSDPNMQFVVSSRVERPVDTGVVTCLGDDAACPPNQMCDRQRLICRDRTP